MKLKVNGEIKSIEPEPVPTTLAAVIEQLGYHPRLVVVEFNGTILTPNHWQEQLVQDMDQLEIVTIVGGGS
ncbi:MAG: sulfur carrier protein ThiS [Prochlorococcus sp.]|jgi:sulfur carrier protein|nr:sulfur carrier protein ThiS [Prochlorococcaceae cyanobacterium ETNP2_MAG_10]MDP6196916.1 sulfur carrier protein ThiS [Prochlorococcaceae cyanobacterium ETNP18_MAG_17]MDP6321859.1 sulfur carrier protein ThiS [Prochlorococcaceae cyanobacterium ETNP14_MAG_5]HJO78199.1 sulfur carrier protein ThiS [Prochlorococcaceae cyanobacterium Fu_MAG_134]|tara:strand:+ start:2766 stop:2978 length:213 start_codon:yes stop_codon:yes gene_type:complete